MSGRVLGLLLLLAGSVWGQGFEGRYRVVGGDPLRGRFTGELELRWRGGDYALTRVVEYDVWRPTGKPVSLVWTGRAVERGAVLDVSLELQRMGWAGSGPGYAPRSAADGVPMPITATFSTGAGGADITGTYHGQGAPFTEPTDAWVYRGPLQPTPLWAPDRQVLPSHSAPSFLTRLGLFVLFRSYHRAAHVRPYVGRAEFDAAVHYFTYDRTDFALHRQRPDLLRLENTLVDWLNLAEAQVKADAFGKPLLVKAAQADAEVRPGFWDPAGSLRRRSNGNPAPDIDGGLWTGAYVYAQALRHQVTGDPAALQAVRDGVAGLLRHMTISGTPTEFARTLTSVPQSGSQWAAGSGAHAGVWWMRAGNNDMYKGLVYGGLAAMQLPAGDPLRAHYGQALWALTQQHAIMGGRRVANRLMGAGISAELTGERAARRRYRKDARNPFLHLFNLAAGGGFHYQGIADWSGMNLNVTGLLAQTLLAEHHGRRTALSLNRLALRRSARMLRRTRRTLHLLAAAGKGGRAGIDASEAIWALRELPFPRPTLLEDRALRADYCLAPYPNLPWKNDWETNLGRAHGYVSAPWFARNLRNYVWKEDPFPKLVGTGRAGEDYASVDLIFAYWAGRAWGLIGPND